MSLTNRRNEIQSSNWDFYSSILRIIAMEFRAVLCNFNDPEEKIDFGIDSENMENLRMTFQLPKRFQFPLTKSSPKEQKEELWMSDCFELFLFDEKKDIYQEINITLSGDWNHYFFDRYRIRSESQWVEAPFQELSYSPQEHRLSILLKTGFPTTRCLLKASCVLNCPRTDKLLYFAPQHPAEQPDFHTRDGAQPFNCAFKTGQNIL